MSEWSMSKGMCVPLNISQLKNKYTILCNTPSDINEHLPTLLRYGRECNHITECGVRSARSSYAFGVALIGKTPNRFIQCDLDTHENIKAFGNEAAAEGVNVTFYQQSDLECPMEPTDLLFIDSWHCYGHLKRELSRWNSSVSKYIIMHDTTIDAMEGESRRTGDDPVKQSEAFGIPVDEICKGLWPAIEEFLSEHSEWILAERFMNNNGLTVLKRVQ